MSSTSPPARSFALPAAARARVEALAVANELVRKRVGMGYQPGSVTDLQLLAEYVLRGVTFDELLDLAIQHGRTLTTTTTEGE